MLVSGSSTENLKLKLESSALPDCNFLNEVGPHDKCRISFVDVELPFNIQLTSIVDLLTATGDVYLQNDGPPSAVGLALVIIASIF
jgi:hypothetical protein